MKNDNRGLTLVEVLVASTMMLIVIISVYSLILTTQTTHLTEGRKMDMNQGGRVIEQILSDNFRSAGSVLAVLNTPSFLGTVVPFNGIYPLNNADYPDGVILASGDPDASTRLTAPFNNGDTMISVITTLRPDGTPAWIDNDVGAVFRSNGYFVFRVIPGGVAPTQLTVRNTSVYYSGLLNTAHYNDLCDEQLLSMGNTSYVSGSPVIRLDYFNIFMVRTEADGTRTLTLTTDCEDVADVMGAPSTPTRAVPLLPNIEDLQIEYITKATPPVVWASSESVHTNPCPSSAGTESTCVDFLNSFYNKDIRSARVYVLLRTEEELNKHAGSGVTYNKPAMGDVPATVLPVGRFHYSYMQYEIMLRNYDIVY